MAGDGNAFDDVLLAEFFFWGGLYIALADGVLHPNEIARLATVAPAGTDIPSLAASGAGTDDRCLRHFRTALAERGRRLSAVELHRIVEGLIAVASADGRIDPEENRRLHDLGAVIGISPRACDMLVAKTMGEQ